MECWDKCVDKVGTSLGRQETCLQNCAERYLDTDQFIRQRMSGAKKWISKPIRILTTICSPPHGVRRDTSGEVQNLAATKSRTFCCSCQYHVSSLSVITSKFAFIVLRLFYAM